MFLAPCIEPFRAGIRVPGAVTPAAPPPPAPVNTVAPVVPSSATEDTMLTATAGTWSNTTSITRQWFREYDAIIGANALTYTPTTGDVGYRLRLREAGVGDGGGPVYAYSGWTDTVVAATPTPPATIPAPIVVRTTGAGDPPEADFTSTDWTKIHPGYYIRVIRSTTGAANPDGSYVTATLSMRVQITVSHKETGTIPLADWVAEGYVHPTGTWYQKYRFEREDGEVSAWSNEISGAIVSSVAEMASSNGVNRNQYLNTSGTPVLNFNMTAHVGSPCLARTLTVATGKRHFEVEVTGINTAGGTTQTIIVGVADLSMALGAASYNIPGSNVSYPGCVVQFTKTGTTATIRRNGGSVTSSAFARAIAIGDFVIVEFDEVADTISYWIRQDGTDYLLGTYTLTSAVPTDYTAVVGGVSGTGTLTTMDSGKVNFGATAFVKTPTSGYSYYG